MRLILLVAVAISSAEAVGAHGLTWAVGDGVTREFGFGRLLVVEGSESVYVAGRLLGSDEYRFAPTRGSVVLSRAPQAWEPVLIRYSWLPMVGFAGPELGADCRTPECRTPGVELRAQNADSAQPTTGSRASDLDVSGSKTVSVSLGGPTAGGLDQSTLLTLNGRVEGVEIQAELSDQSSGIPVEGTTRELDELDRTTIGLRGSNWRASFGDVDLSLPAGGFGVMDRRIVGLRVAGNVAGLEGSALYAVPKGQHGRAAFSGADGVQGPYVLSGGSGAVQVIPGSERVFLDGERLARGWDRDYTIDYSTGELTFTSRRPVTRSARIEADFQQAVTAYSRADIAVAAQGRSGAFGCGLAVLREGDDPSRSLAIDLTEADRQYLGSVGADTGRAWLDGARYVGAGNGGYVSDGAGYRYVGPDSGDYDVQFTLVGDSAGDHEYDAGRLAYRYVGAGAGNYVARIRAALPERRDLLLANAAYAAGAWTFGLEGAFLDTRRNLFATDGAALRAGALNVDAAWGDSARRIAYARRVRGRAFDFPGTDPDVDFAYRWGGTQLEERRVSDEFTVRVQPSRDFSIGVEGGRLSLRDTGAVLRYSGDVRFAWVRAAAASAGSRTRLLFEAMPHLGWFEPAAGWRVEAGPTLSEQHFRVGLVSRPVRPVELGLDCDLGTDNERAGPGWRRTSVGRLAQGRVALGTGGACEVEARAGYSDRRFDAAQQDNWRRLFGAASLSCHPRAGLQLQIDAEQSGRRAQLRDEAFRYVGDGLGDYRRDSVTGEYVAEPAGDYERVVVPTGRYVMADERTLTGSAEFSAWQALAFFASVAHSGTVADTGALAGTARADVRVVMRALEPAATPAAGIALDRTFDRTLTATGAAAERGQVYVEAFSDKWPALVGKVRAEASQSRSEAGAGQAEREETGLSLVASPVVGRLARVELTAGVGRKLLELPSRHPELGRFSLLSRSLGAARSFCFGQRTRCRGAVDLVQRSATVSALPYEVALTEPAGWSAAVRLDFSHQVSDMLSATARYSLSARPDRALEHSLSAELRADF